MKVMIWNAARGGMRSVVTNYLDAGFIAANDIHLIHSYANATFACRQILLLRALTRFSSLLATRRIELVHIHSAARGSFWRKALFAKLARLRGVPVLLHLHGSEMKGFYDRQPRALKAAITGQLERATRVLVLSQSWRDFVIGIAPRARVLVVPNCVALPPPVARSPSANTTLLFLGEIGPRKGIFDLLRAFAMALGQQPTLQLVIGGHGQLEQARRLAAELGVASRVDFRGWVGPEERSALLATSDIYVLPSFDEGLPMSVLEAMAAGLPAITTDVGGLPELVTHGENGFLIRPGTVAALAATILRLASDPENRQQLGKAARERVAANYSRESVLKVLSSVYADVADLGPKPKRL